MSEGDVAANRAKGRLVFLRLAVAASFGVALILMTPSQRTRAANLGATFLPDHAAPGSSVLVAYLPRAADCPSVHIYLSRQVSPTPPISSARDRRLMRLIGTVAYRTGYGPNSTGPTPRTTTFTFRVPALTPGIYGTYAQCVGGPPVSSTFGPGAGPFTVDPAGVPATATATASVSEQRMALTWPVGGIAIAVSGLLWRWRLSAPRMGRRPAACG